MGSVSLNHEAANAAEIISLVRGGDYDRFLAIQLAPKAKRAALYALTAFYVEIARIAETVSAPLMGHMRLAWWREALEELVAGKAPRNHPVMLALAPLLVAQPVLVAWLLQMLDARAADVDDTLLVDEDAWLAYCDNTAGALHRAWALVLDKDAAEEQARLIAPQARAYAMIGLVRAVPFMAQHGWVRFPEARLQAHGVTSLAPSAALNAMVKSIVADAAAMNHTQPLEKCLYSLAAIATLNHRYMQILHRCGGNPYKTTSGNLGKIWYIVKLNYL